MSVHYEQTQHTDFPTGEPFQKDMCTCKAKAGSAQGPTPLRRSDLVLASLHYPSRNPAFPLCLTSHLASSTAQLFLSLTRPQVSVLKCLWPHTVHFAPKATIQVLIMKALRSPSFCLSTAQTISITPSVNLQKRIRPHCALW